MNGSIRALKFQKSRFFDGRNGAANGEDISAQAATPGQVEYTPIIIPAIIQNQSMFIRCFEKGSGLRWMRKLQFPVKLLYPPPNEFLLDSSGTLSRRMDVHWHRHLAAHYGNIPVETGNLVMDGVVH